MRESGGLVQEEILDDNALHRGKSRRDVVRVRVGLGNVLTLDVQAFEAAIERSIEHVRNSQSWLGFEGDSPGRLERATNGVVRDVPVRAPFLQIEGLSAHADAGELQRWALSGPSKPASTFFVHGEPEGLDALQGRFRQVGLPGVIPTLNQVFERKTKGIWIRVR